MIRKKVRFVAKLSAVLSLGIVSFLSTSAFLAPKAFTAPRRVQAPSDSGGPRTEVGFERAGAAGGDVGETTTLGSATRRLEVATCGNFLRIDALGSVRDKRSQVGYAWSIRVVDAENPSIVYWEQWFDVVPTTADTWSDVPLDEVVELPIPDGVYSLEVDMFRVPEGPWPGIQAEPRQQDALGSCGGRRMITIRR